MTYKILASTCLFITIVLTSCGPSYFRSPFAPPTPTPPAGFFNMDSLVPGQYLRNPSLSADGKILAAFGSLLHEGEYVHLYVIDVENGELLFTGDERRQYSLALSPDGKTIAVWGHGESGDGIYLVDWSSDSTSYFGDGYWPTWTPDDQTLVYVYASIERSDPMRRVQIRAYDLTTATETILLDILSPRGSIGHISLAAENDEIVFVAANLETPYQAQSILHGSALYVLEKDFGTLKIIADSTSSIYTPHFSSEGEKVLYVDWSAPLQSYSNYLQVVTLEGNCHRVLSPVPRIRTVALSSQGNVIACGTRYGLLVADTETALGSDFWEVGDSCEVP